MNKVENFAKNLESIRKTRKKSLTEFVREIGIPKSTLQSILKDGNTTLDTASRVADSLHISLDNLISKEESFDDIRFCESVKEIIAIFDGLDYEQQTTLEYYIIKILEIISKKRETAKSVASIAAALLICS